MTNIPVHSPDPSTPQTIRDLELRMEQALDRLRSSSAATSSQEASSLLIELRSLFIPSKFRATVQLEEEGRKKRSTAAASNWNPANGEIVLYFEPASTSWQGEPRLELVAPIAMEPSATVSPGEHTSVSQTVKASPDDEVEQCCSALADAERAGKHFIALKWFRDLVLAGLPFDWSKSPEERQRVLTQAIEAGAIITKKIPNPKYPAFPTTTLSLNRASSNAAQPEVRFKPVPIKGEPGSATLLQDRGSY